jgi:lysophospholipase L1-like esterase
MKTSPTPFKIKLLILFTSLVICVVLAELLLRSAGGVILARNDHLNKMGELDPHSTRILAVGDSFTNGGMTRYDQDYPHVLEQMLNKDKGRSVGAIHVINAGVCGATTRELLGFLPEWIEKYRPRIVVFLAGSANWFTLLKRMINDGSGDGLAPLSGFFTDLRIVKVAKLMAFESFAERMAEDRRPRDIYGRSVSMDSAPNTRWSAYTAYIQAGPRPTGDGPAAAVARIHKAAGDERDGDVLRLLGDAQRQFPGSELIANASAYYLREIGDRFRSSMKRYLAIEYYLAALQHDPQDPYLYHWISVLHQYQSRFSAEMLKRSIEDLAQALPAVAESELHRRYVLNFKERMAEEDAIMAETRRDLEAIASLCRAHGITLIIQNYPVPYQMINDELQRFARQQDLPFVDNLRAFEYNQHVDRYFFDDEHCTFEGHAIIAGNVAGVLRKVLESR